MDGAPASYQNTPTNTVACS